MSILDLDILEKYSEILRNLPGYERRRAQEIMVGEVARAMGESESIVIEAGTGSGKSFGYLVPALLQKKRPVVVSTATIALQEQLLDKDIPFLVDTAGLDEVNVKLVKGRGNFLCIQKLTELERQINDKSSDRLYINYLKGELKQGWDGDRANLDLAVPNEIWNEVKSDTEDCLGRKCPYYDQNPYRLSREDLDKADLLIVNHALYLQDIGSGNSLLPPHDIVVFDEAHQLKHYALNSLTVRIGKYATTKLLQKIHRRLQPLPERYHHLVSESEAAILEWLFRNEQTTFRLKTDDFFLYLVKRHLSVLTELEQWLGTMNVKQLSIVVSDLDADRANVQRDKLMNQLRGLMTRWEFFLEADPFSVHRVNWAEVDHDRLYYELKSTPLDIADTLEKLLWCEKTAVLTSATLSVNEKMNFFKAEMGIEEAKDLLLPSPFDYEKQCALYLPDGVPDPNDPMFVPAIANEIAEILHRTRGRALVLFTSYQNMRRVADSLIPTLPFPCKLQGELPRARLIEWFKETPNSVIFATSTFWEGIDIQGDALSCVIMDKIPFVPPGDPVHQAQVDFIKARGGDWFGDLALPQAIIRLKQGFGRLIRSKTDKGLVAILDPRVKRKGYGRIIQRSLPKVQVCHNLDEISPVFLNLPPDDLLEGLFLNEFEQASQESA